MRKRDNIWRGSREGERDIESIVEKMARELIDIQGNISAQELAERIGVSESSIRHHLASVRGLFREQGVNLMSVPQKGLYIEATDKQREDIDSMLKQFANHDPVSEGFRRDYIFQTVFRYQGSYTLQLLAEELYVSRSMISKDLQYLNDFLKMFHVKIAAKKNKGIFIEGHEFEIRQALILYNNQKWWKESYLEPPRELDVRISSRAWTFLSNFYPECMEEIWDIQKALLDMEKKTEFVFTDISIGRLMEYLAITRERMKSGKYILSYIREKHLLIEKKYLEAAEIFLSLYINAEDACWEYERTYLAARLCEAYTIQSRGRLSGYGEDIKRYLREVKNVLGYYYDGDDRELVRGMEDLVTAMRYRDIYRIYDWTDLCKDVKEWLAGLYAVCMTQIYILEEASGLSFKEDDIARIALLVQSYMKKRRPEAVFVTAANEEESYYNLKKLKEELPYIHFKEVIHYRNFKPEDHRREFVISTVVLKEKAANLICITKHVNRADMELIKRRIEEKGRQFPEILEKVFSEELIYDMTAQSKEDALKKAVSGLMEQGYVEEGFLEEALAREKILATSIGNKVAIPHVYKKHVCRSGVSIIRLKNSVKWSDEERVDLIFLFAIGEEDSRDIKKIFHHMYHVLKEEDLIDKIRGAESKEEILKLMLICENGTRH